MKRDRLNPLNLVTMPGDMDHGFTVGNQIMTVPNLITLLRLCCVPVFVWLLFGAEQRFSAALLLGALGATDWVDGWLARRLDQHSEFGKVFDPAADRIMFIVAIAAMIIDGSVPLWFALAVLVREVLVGLGALAIGLAGAERFDVTWWGKAATFGLMFTFPLFLASYSTVGDTTLWQILAWGIGLPSLAASWYAAAGYGPLARRAFSPDRTSA